MTDKKNEKTSKQPEQVILQNLGKKRKVYLLVHQETCVKAGRCFCIDGKCATIHISPNGGVSENLPSGVLMSPEIQKDLGGRQPILAVRQAKEQKPLYKPDFIDPKKADKVGNRKKDKGSPNKGKDQGKKTKN